ncbi:hypothetical protein [Novosphingobium huizhouense]|uniref:hypothetical protein n=1 Tax=Novosphingobium huizhouense TaxID=2866625 RepID=UPI001CD8FF17|nr:hypothetical protein [Novosphingobium huizhouense]
MIRVAHSHGGWRRGNDARRGAGAAAAAAVTIALALLPDVAQAYVITIASGSRAIFLQIGAGGYNAPSNQGGTPANNTTINTVSVTIAAADVGSGTSREMTSNSTVAQSPIDGFAYCNPPAQVYIGAWSRTNGNNNATLTVTTPASLTSGTSTIPFSQIRWTMSGNGDTVFQFPDGTFNGGTQSLGTISPNTWEEQCMTFTYFNSTIPAAGTYTGRAVYTLSLP